MNLQENAWFTTHLLLYLYLSESPSHYILQKLMYLDGAEKKANHKHDEDPFVEIEFTPLTYPSKRCNKQFSGD